MIFVIILYTLEHTEHAKTREVVSHCDLNFGIFRFYVDAILDRLCHSGKANVT